MGSNKNNFVIARSRCVWLHYRSFLSSLQAFLLRTGKIVTEGAPPVRCNRSILPHLTGNFTKVECNKLIKSPYHHRVRLTLLTGHIYKHSGRYGINPSIVNLSCSAQNPGWQFNEDENKSLQRRLMPPSPKLPINTFVEDPKSSVWIYLS